MLENEYEKRIQEYKELARKDVDKAEVKRIKQTKRKKKQQKTKTSAKFQ